MSKIHTVRPNENLSLLAQRYGTTVSALQKANGISNPNKIFVGQRLVVDGFDAPKAAAPRSGSGGSSYTVKSGDTLSGIAGRHGTTVAALQQANGIANPNKIYVGQKLTIPGAGGTSAPSRPSSGGGQSYTVKSGDTLSGIAGRHGTTVGALQQANGIANPNKIYVGQKLTIPGAGGPSAPSSPPPSSGGQRYTVKSGDTLSGIAGRFGTTVGALQQANGISNPNRIYAGQTLTIPGGGSPSRPPPTNNPPVGGVGGPKPPTGGSAGVTVAQLRRVMPNLSQAKAEQYLPYLNQAMAEANITTPMRKAAFLAQLAHESGELRYMEEIASGAAYEGRRDLGNTQPGDGVRYKGRGPIQLTGRANYRSAGAALGIDLEGNPTRAKDPDVAFRIAGWYWSSRNLNTYADAGNFREVTRRINGGYNGMADREAYYRRALDVF
ncbi:LysM peptidoglycan-binding domain-containing protein [Pyxidicoccus fallax]|uniref:LysM peptidoglycan-binding domain-containing protein n=1 Tax=Pyxidicoccus fallax TaxID=394095 RepID=A0A848L6Y9_9BACT|nr:LysM peptidoglycan-binding domain-containing protein [Pyxidicoccus fallax]NPC76636.1 LysM peptidoglycan-binding domain-containing protein [Pyxidicoccus fallax]